MKSIKNKIMKITEKIVLPITILIIHMIPVVLYNLGYKGGYQVSLGVIFALWVSSLIFLCMLIVAGEIKFELKIPLPFQKKFEESKRKKSHNQMIDTKILELKADSVCYIENEKRLLKNLEAIEELEKLKL